MSRDSLFVGQSSAEPAAEVTPFATTADRHLARALTDLLLIDGEPFKINTLDGLAQRFRIAGLEAQFDSWMARRENLSVSSGQLRKALGDDVIHALQDRIPLNPGEILDRLTSILPKVIEEATPFGGKPSERTYHFHLESLRKRLA